MTRYEIGDFTVDTESIEVGGPDGERSFEPQVFDVLLYLIEQRGRLVTKEELLDNVWGDRFVSESAMTTRIKQARRLLDDDGRNQWAIKTVHGRGYRFVPDVRVDTPKVPSSPALETAALPAELRVDARHLFCGRVAELAQALSVVGDDAGSSEEVTRAGDDHPIGWVWVLGEPGIGKTRLAAEIAAAVREIGHLVFFGRNNEDLRVPYKPFIEVIRASAPHVDSERRAALAAALPVELARLLPELEAAEDPHGGARPRASTANDAGRRYELFEAMSEWLAACATDRPVTVVIDDVHWASDSTLHLIGHLQQRRQLRGCVNVVVTSRDTAPDINAVVADLFAKAQGVERSTVIRLAGLSADDARRLVGADVSLDEVLRQTAGNPLLLQAVNPVDGAVDLQGAVRRRLSRLDEDVRATLAMASVVG
ncbi:MAG: AAA family ATPase, partial [Ilumatobacter sp.]